MYHADFVKQYVMYHADLSKTVNKDGLRCAILILVTVEKL